MEGRPVPGDENAPLTLLDEAADYLWYAERWGWTPVQVEAQPAWILERLPTAAAALDEAKANLAERARAQAEMQAARAAARRG